MSDKTYYNKLPNNREEAMPHGNYDDPTNRINKLLDEIEERIGLEQNLVITCGVQTLEGRQFRCTWRRGDNKFVQHHGTVSGERSVHGVWLEEALRKVLYYEDEVDEAMAAPRGADSAGQNSE